MAVDDELSDEELVPTPRPRRSRPRLRRLPPGLARPRAADPSLRRLRHLPPSAAADVPVVLVVDVTATPVSGRGMIHLPMLLHQGAPAPGVDYGAGPYPVVTVELEEQERLRFTSTLIDATDEQTRIGQPVELAWIDRYGAPFPVFRPADAGGCDAPATRSRTRSRSSASARPSSAATPVRSPGPRRLDRGHPRRRTHRRRHRRRRRPGEPVAGRRSGRHRPGPAARHPPLEPDARRHDRAGRRHERRLLGRVRHRALRVVDDAAALELALRGQRSVPGPVRGLGARCRPREHQMAPAYTAWASRYIHEYGGAEEFGAHRAQHARQRRAQPDGRHEDAAHDGGLPRRRA